MTITLPTTSPVSVGLKTPYQEVLKREELCDKLGYTIIAHKRSPEQRISMDLWELVLTICLEREGEPWLNKYCLF